MAGLHFRERMRGRLYLMTDPLREIPIEIELEARIHAMDRVASLTGRVSVGSRGAERASSGVSGAEPLTVIAQDAPVQGTLGLLALNKKRLPYDVYFLTDAGERWRMRGEKDITYLAPVRSLTTLPFTIYEEDSSTLESELSLRSSVRHSHEVARGTLEFDWRHDLGSMIRSLRPSLF